MNPIRLAGCVITDQKGNILLLHRNTPQLVQWELPGGKIEQDETAHAAAKREVYEELGIKVAVGKYLGAKEFIDAGVRFHYSWYAASVVSGKPTVMEPEKFNDVRYVALDEIRKNPALFSVNLHNFLAIISTRA